MPDIIKITRDLTGLIGNACTCFFDSMFGWLWLAALLLVVAVVMLSGPIKAFGGGGPSLNEVIAVIGAMLLIGAGGSWTHYMLGEERAIKSRIGENADGVELRATLEVGIDFIAPPGA